MRCIEKSSGRKGPPNVLIYEVWRRDLRSHRETDQRDGGIIGHSGVEACQRVRLVSPCLHRNPPRVIIDIAPCRLSHFFVKDSELNGTDTIIRQLEQLASSIDRALTALRGITNQDSGAVAATSAGVVQRKRRRMSAAARKRIGDAARRRWAAMHAAQGSAKPATVKRRKRRLSPEGRQRIVEATKRRWAAKRAADAAAQAKRARKTA
jgi:hypothetical protein